MLTLFQRPPLLLEAPPQAAALRHTRPLRPLRPCALVRSVVPSQVAHPLVSLTATPLASPRTLAVLLLATLASSLPRLPPLWQLWLTRYKRFTNHGYHKVVQVSLPTCDTHHASWTDISPGVHGFLMPSFGVGFLCLRRGICHALGWSGIAQSYNSVSIQL